MIVIGIDPGKRGGWVALNVESGRPVPVEWCAADQTDGGYVMKGRYLTRAMYASVFDVVDNYNVVGVMIERQQARPMEGRASILTTGYGWGLWTGIVASMQVPYDEVSSTRWTRSMLTGSTHEGKARSIAVAQQRVPDLPLVWGRRRKPHDGLADAACLALYAWMHFGVHTVGKTSAPLRG